ncbi:uncharacterized protein LOC112559708 isoform X3 [Pomacea canaliculata]|uniref:uncharacterized protein LOC112559708 isoform X3 n=1 Tax=Pomacea canaliculata TaxID=400727 RepID=UPI000D7391C9|nr:uncharacterized protein LOC112559708 isoform X3 [Pomacea canaliculata]
MTGTLSPGSLSTGPSEHSFQTSAFGSADPAFLSHQTSKGISSGNGLLAELFGKQDQNPGVPKSLSDPQHDCTATPNSRPWGSSDSSLLEQSILENILKGRAQDPSNVLGRKSYFSDEGDSLQFSTDRDLDCWQQNIIMQDARESAKKARVQDGLLQRLEVALKGHNPAPHTAAFLHRLHQRLTEIKANRVQQEEELQAIKARFQQQLQHELQAASTRRLAIVSPLPRPTAATQSHTASSSTPTQTMDMECSAGAFGSSREDFVRKTDGADAKTDFHDMSLINSLKTD